MSFSRLLTVVLTTVISSAAQADVIFVDDDNCPGPGSGTEGDPYCSIQTSIDNAVDGDEVVIAPGTYFETIDFLGKAVTLRSSDGPEKTIIDAQGTGRVVACENGEGPDTMLSGFTITGGDAIDIAYPTNSGGGMRNWNASPTVANCIFVDNQATSAGGISNIGSNARIINCTIRTNTATNVGGGMANTAGSNPMVLGCLFHNNRAQFQDGGGMRNLGSSPAVICCTFVGNFAHRGDGGGMASSYSGNPSVTGCIFWPNFPNEIVDFPNASTTVLYSAIEGGWPGTGNIARDPMFVDPDNANYRLSPGSPCIDAGDNSAVPEFILRDLDGNRRFVVGTTSFQSVAGPIVDMGAYEYQPDSSVEILLRVILGSEAAAVARHFGSCP